MISVFTVLFGGIIRLVPHLPNFTPVTAMALFGGTHISKRFALVVPLLTLIISDYLLLYINPYKNPMFIFTTIHAPSEMFHATTLYVWGSVLLSGLIGLWLRNHLNMYTLVGASLFCSVQFFLITNFGVWAAGYSGEGLSGLLSSYIMGLPFFKWTILGDLFYTSVFFGVYELGRMTRKNTQKMKV